VYVRVFTEVKKPSFHPVGNPLVSTTHHTSPVGGTTTTGEII